MYDKKTCILLAAAPESWGHALTLACMCVCNLFTCSWKKHNPPAPPPSPSPPAPGVWVTQDNHNYVFNAQVGSAAFPLLGHPANAAACQALCKVRCFSCVAGFIPASKAPLCHLFMATKQRSSETRRWPLVIRAVYGLRGGRRGHWRGLIGSRRCAGYCRRTPRATRTPGTISTNQDTHWTALAVTTATTRPTPRMATSPATTGQPPLADPDPRHRQHHPQDRLTSTSLRCAQPNGMVTFLFVWLFLILWRLAHLLPDPYFAGGRCLLLSHFPINIDGTVLHIGQQRLDRRHARAATERRTGDHCTLPEPARWR